MSAPITDEHRKLYLHLCGLLFVDEATCIETEGKGAQLLADHDAAVRRETLEEAAKECERILAIDLAECDRILPGFTNNDDLVVEQLCAAAIRDLAKRGAE